MAATSLPFSPAIQNIVRLRDSLNATQAQFLKESQLALNLSQKSADKKISDAASKALETAMRLQILCENLYRELEAKTWEVLRSDEQRPQLADALSIPMILRANVSFRSGCVRP